MSVRKQQHGLFAMFALTLGVAALYAFRLDAASLRGDEGFTALCAQWSLPAIVEGLRTIIPHPPLYHLFMRGWVALLGGSDLVLRWPSLVAGVLVACIGVVVFLSEKLLAERWQAGRGDLVLLVAASFFSYYTVAAKPVIMRPGPEAAYGDMVRVYDVLRGGKDHGVEVKNISIPTQREIDQFWY